MEVGGDQVRTPEAETGSFTFRNRRPFAPGALFTCGTTDEEEFG